MRPFVIKAKKQSKMQVRREVRGFLMGDVRLYASKENVSATKYNAADSLFLSQRFRFQTYTLIPATSQ